MIKNLQAVKDLKTQIIAKQEIQMQEHIALIAANQAKALARIDVIIANMEKQIAE